MKILKAVSMFGLLGIFLAGCINIPIGDGKLKITSDGVTITDDEGKEHDVSFDEDNEQLTISGEEGEVAFGSELAIPASFPDDIPLADDAIVFAATEAEMVVSVSYGSEIDVNEIDEMYRTYFDSNIFEETSNAMMTNEGMLATEYDGKRQDGRLAVVIQGTSESEEGTMVFIVFDGSSQEE